MQGKLMNPSRRRLPVARPDFGNKQSADSDCAHGGGDGIIPEPKTGDARSPKKSPPKRGQENQKRFRQPEYAAAIHLPGISTGDFVSSNLPLAITVAEEEDRSFELGDLLTRQWAARNSSFLVSFAIHTFLILLFSLVLITGTGKAIIVLEMLSSPAIEEEDGVIAEIEVDIEDNELISPFDDDLFNTALGESDGDQQITDIGDMAGAEGSGESRSGSGDGKSAKFFGTKAQGNKFVYVLDRSGSMDYTSADVNNYRVSRFDVARMELLKSVDSLQPHQEFYVVLFSTGMKQMFNEESLLPQPVKATPENKERLKDWLWEDRAFGGTDPRDSLKLAFKMNPDAIFMLSDGEFRDERDGDPLSIDIARRQVNENTPIRINSIALEDDASKANMEELSDVSGGQFRFVKVRDYINEIAANSEDLLFGGKEIAPEGDLSNWSVRYVLATTTIPLLKSRTEDDRKRAEEKLNELSYGLFAQTIPSVTGDYKPSTSKKAAEMWEEVWANANDQAVVDKLDSTGRRTSVLGTSTSAGLFSHLANVGQKNFLESVESLNAEQMEPLHQIAVARSILSFQEHRNVVNERSRVVLIEFLDELNKFSKAKFGRDYFIKNATQETCQRRLKTVLNRRRGEAGKLLRKVKDRKTAEADRVAYANELISLFPETKYASDVKSLVTLPDIQPEAN